MRQALIGCLLTAFIVTFALVGGGAFYYYVLHDEAGFLYSDYDKPDLGVHIGAGRFTASTHPAGADLGTVTDLVFANLDETPGNEWALADGYGIQILEADFGLRTFTPLAGTSEAASFVLDPETNTYHAYNSVKWSTKEALAVYDLSGSRLWGIDSDATYGFMVHGDTNGDGTPEFLAVEFFDDDRSSAVSLYDRNGQRQWIENVENLNGGGLEDLNGDGLEEILTVEGSSMVFRDETGNVRSTALMQAGINQAWSVEWPLGAGRKYLMTDGEERFVFLDDSARTVRDLDAADLWYITHLRAVSLRFGAEGPPYLAVLASNEYDDFSQLYVYDENDAVIYYEVIDEYCGALYVAKNEDGDSARLIVGGYARLIEYLPVAPSEAG